jgi:prepilin-type N-terminal cleavage/methylation domain-containing protein
MALSVEFSQPWSADNVPPFFQAGANSGVTLLELAISMMIVAVISVGVSGLIKVGAEHNLSERQHQTMQLIAMDLVDDLRRDLLTADTISNLGSSGSNTLTITGNGHTVTYAMNSSTHQMTRAANGITKIYNDPKIFLSNLRMDCVSATNQCFQVNTTAGTASNGTPKAIFIPNLTISAPPGSGGGTVIDQAFGAPNFKLNQFSFNMTTSTEFQ